MRLLILLLLVGLVACKKHHDDANCGSEIGTLKRGSSLGLSCTEALFIVKSDNQIIQPVIAGDLLNGFGEGEVVKFGYREVFLGMRACGENITTVKLLCASSIK